MSNNLPTTGHILRPIHPFPARMAPSIVEDVLIRKKNKLRVLDPMMGSGTVLATARLLGHHAIGFDSDPLAVLISQTWCSDFDAESFVEKGEIVLERAYQLYRKSNIESALTLFKNDETREFVRYWFDAVNIKQLAAISLSISHLHDENAKKFLWCAFSRMIITKGGGVSRAIDISHSRPHRVYDTCPKRPFDVFPYSLKTIVRRAPFKIKDLKLPKAKISLGDSRSLNMRANSADLIITSPPYFNAIDYMRGHKLALVWMRHELHELREIRSQNIGAENQKRSTEAKLFYYALDSMNIPDTISNRERNTIFQYASDMNKVMHQMYRVLSANGEMVIVIGNCMYKGIFINNACLVKLLARKCGLKLRQESHRLLPANRRYLPPPSSRKSGLQLRNRMREEVVLSFNK